MGRYGIVAIITGRRADEVRRLVDVPGVRYEGLYGLEDRLEPSLVLRSAVEDAASAVPQAWVEEKGISIAIHYRQSPDPSAARSALVERLTPVARENGLHLLEGKMVVELVPDGRPLKGGVVDRLCAEARLRAALYAGDDIADVDAFEALGRLAEAGLVTVRVAVRTDETPDELVSAADLVVDGPLELVELLATL